MFRWIVIDSSPEKLNENYRLRAESHTEYENFAVCLWNCPHLFEKDPSWTWAPTVAVIIDTSWLYLKLDSIINVTLEKDFRFEVIELLRNNDDGITYKLIKKHPGKYCCLADALIETEEMITKEYKLDVAVIAHKKVVRETLV